jgi:hypothetical protein
VYAGEKLKLIESLIQSIPSTLLVVVWTSLVCDLLTFVLVSFSF